MTSPQEQNKERMTVAQAADLSHVTRQAIYSAIRKKQLNAQIIGKQWYVTVEDLEKYRLNKYNRDLRKRDGEFIFDMQKGHFSVHQVAKILSSALGKSYPSQRIYYLMRMGYLKAFKSGAAWVIKKEDAVRLLEQERANSSIYMRE